MLPSIYRLPRQEFPFTLKSGKKIHTPALTIVYYPSTLVLSRFGIIVSSKVSKSAVKRNQIKRRLRAVVVSSLTKLKTPADIILIANPPITNSSYQSLADTIYEMFSSNHH